MHSFTGSKGVCKGVADLCLPGLISANYNRWTDPFHCVAPLLRLLKELYVVLCSTANPRSLYFGFAEWKSKPVADAAVTSSIFLL